jgi:putative serine protease PepD
MMNLRSDRVLVAAGALAIAAAGAGAGAGIYAALGPGGTTTVVSNVTTVGRGQPIAETAGLTVTEIYQRAYKGVVDIRVGGSSFSFGRGGRQGQGGEGSGFVYDSNGHVVTNQHVVDGATSISIKLWDGSTYPAHVVGSDTSTDLAVIKVSAPKSALQPLALGDSDGIQVGSGVVAIGSPFGLAGSVTSGIVSAVHRSIDAPNNITIADANQTDAPINHGNTAGPLLNARAQVVGVNAQIQSESGGNEGVGFAIPSNTVKSVVSQLIAGKTVPHAYLGVRVEDASSSSNAGTGAVVREIIAGMPAARAGLKVGDVIVRMAGNRISAADDLTGVISSKKPGDTISVTYVRNGVSHTVQLKLATRPTA